MELTNDFRVAVPVERAWAVLTDVERIAPCLPGAQLQEVQGEEYRGIVKVKVGPITATYKGAATFVEKDDANHKAVLKAEGREMRGQGNATALITAQLTAEGDGTAVTINTDLTVTGKVAQFGRGVMADVSAKLLGQFVASLEETVLSPEGAGAAAAESTEAPPPAKAATKKAAAKKAPAKKAAATTKATTSGSSSAPAPATDETVDASPNGSAAGAETPPPDVTRAPAPAVRRIESPEPQPVDLLDTAGAPVAKRVAPIVGVIAVLWLLRVLLRRRKR